MNYAKNYEQVMSHYSASGAFLTVKAGEELNTMTVSWGFMGFFWAKPYFIVGVRPQRFTKHILDKADSFTISVPFGTMKEELEICGTKSGADMDKGEIVKFMDSRRVSSPVVKGCDMYYECSLSFSQPLQADNLPGRIADFYKDDRHTFYFGEIVDCYGF